MSNALYEKGRQGFLDGSIDWDTDTIKVVLVDLGNYGIAISGATNATPIVITTGSAHGLTTGDTVYISGVGGNTAANGKFTVTVLSSTTFSLDSSVGNGAYTSGGTLIKLGADDNLDDVPSGARIATSAALSGKTVVDGVADANDVTLTSVSGASVEGLVIYKDTGTASTSRLICFIDTAASGLPFTPDGGNVTITWSNGTSKIFKL